MIKLTPGVIYEAKVEENDGGLTFKVKGKLTDKKTHVRPELFPINTKVKIKVHEDQTINCLSKV